MAEESFSDELSEEEETVLDEDIVTLAQANNYLAFHLYQLLSREDENILFSPFSLSVAMGMLLCAAEGETASELQTALGHEKAGIKKDDVAAVFEKQMTLLLQPNDSYTLSCANSMLNQISFKVKDEYKKILSESFKALLLEVDFLKENEEAVNQINEWVKEKTNNMIPKLVQFLDPSNVMILLNAVYFKGTWMKQFEKEATFVEAFYNKGIEENAKEVEMMHRKDAFLYYEEETFQALEFPYIGEEIAMLVLLPREKNGLGIVEANLSPTFLHYLKQNHCEYIVDITFPRFRLEYTKSLVPYFIELGIRHVFTGGAELSVASDSPDLSVSEILHKAVLEVNEEGSEAAAATSVEMFMTEPIEPVFIADHPFMFMIYNTKSDLILFMGRVNEL